MTQKKAVSQGIRWIAQAASRRSASTNSRIIAPPQARTISTSQIPPACRVRPLSLGRPFSSTPARKHGDVTPPKPGEEVYVTFIDRDKVEHKIPCNVGDNLLDLAQAHDLDIEGACGGSCACSTCHVIVADSEYYDKLPTESEDEGDMLDLAFGLTDTSRLGCQVVMSKEIDGIVVKLPHATRNLQARDFGS
ncbi:ferredoxin [Zalerion maritima]|uniref:Ferredoxin n=1 Tax=Zalerion maritima TaxID=339359 RepID=A0AAD5RQI5_9PEZI|nr:ferredoxin [Zalerion maritima]